MSNMVLQSNAGSDFKPHPEGIHPAVCVDVIDLGLREVEFQGQRKWVNKLRLVFESEQRLEDGRNCTISKNFTASLHPKAKLADFLGKWRGRPVVPGETIDLGKLIGACCTLVVSHQQNMVGKIYASIDAVSKPTKRLAASGHYDPVAARQRLEQWKAKQFAPRQGVSTRPPQAAPFDSQAAPLAGAPGLYRYTHGAFIPPPALPSAPAPSFAQPAPAQPQRQAAPVPQEAPAAEPNMDYDPDVGF